MYEQGLSILNNSTKPVELLSAGRRRALLAAPFAGPSDARQLQPEVLPQLEHL